MHLPKTNSYSVAALAVSGWRLHPARLRTPAETVYSKEAFAFRHVAIQNVDGNGDPSEITATYGTITFDGAGNYPLTGTTVDNTVSSGAPQALERVPGTYAIGSNGAGYIANPLYPTDYNMYIYGAVAQGVYTGSSTESGRRAAFSTTFLSLFRLASAAHQCTASHRPIRRVYWISRGQAARRSRTRCSS